MKARTDSRKARAIDACIGQNIKQARQSRSISQQDLARHLDISYQQVQKYERGNNRISAGRLYQVAQLMDIPVEHFYRGALETAEDTDRSLVEPLSEKEALTRVAQKVPYPKLKKAIMDLVDAVYNEPIDPK